MSNYTRKKQHGTVMCLLLVLVGMLVLTGCSSARSSNTHVSRETAVWWDSEYPAYNTRASSNTLQMPGMELASRNTPSKYLSSNHMERSFRSVLIDTAHVALGTPYVSGGTTLRGFDCSGFVQWAYRSLGVKLPRTAREQASYGTPVQKCDLQVGDIVAFRHPRRGYHTGIYVGDGKFIHSPRRNKSIEIVPLNSAYYRENYLCARRCALPSDRAQLKQAVAQLEKYKAIKAAINKERRRYTYASYTPTQPRRYTNASSSRSSRRYTNATPPAQSRRYTNTQTSSSRRNEKISSRERSRNKRQSAVRNSSEKRNRQQASRTSVRNSSSREKNRQHAHRQHAASRQQSRQRR